MLRGVEWGVVVESVFGVVFEWDLGTKSVMGESGGLGEFVDCEV